MTGISDTSDIANYPTILTLDFRERVVREEPTQIMISFPKTAGRSFSSSYYSKQMPNGEQVLRDWLLYSKILDAAFSFCCRIFGNNIGDVGIGSSKGFRYWAHLSRTVKLHELNSLCLIWTVT